MNKIEAWSNPTLKTDVKSDKRLRNRISGKITPARFHKKIECWQINMKLVVRLLKILLVSGVIAAVGAGLIIYYLDLRLGELKALKSLAWEPLIVIASLWFVTNLLVVYLLGRTAISKTKETAPKLSGSALADLHSDKEKFEASKNPKKKSDKKENKKAERKSKKSRSSSESMSVEGKNTSTPKPASPVLKDGETTGIIKWFNGQKGYGFITSADGDEVFVHCRSIKAGGNRQLHTGQQVSFTLLREDKGLKAEQVVILE